MFRNLLILFTFFISSMAFAQNVPNPCADIAEATRGKTSTQIDTILQTCRGEAGAAPVITVDNAKQWSEIAQSFASAAGTAAKELGVATNEFLNSPAGYLLAAVLVFNYGGGLVIIGIPFAILSLFMFYYAWRLAYTRSVTYTETPVLWGFWSIRRKTRVLNDTLSESRAFFLGLTGVFIALLNVVFLINLA